MSKNADTLHRFYRAFAQLDAATMGECYADNAEFCDPVFTLAGKCEVAGMWSMLCEATQQRARDDWKLEYSEVWAEGDRARAHWDARYRFSATGRLVLNRIDAQMRFNEHGLIVEHRDSFDFWRWSRQALGTPGLLLGWTPFLRNKVRRQARANLEKFLSRKILSR